MTFDFQSRPSGGFEDLKSGRANDVGTPAFLHRILIVL